MANISNIENITAKEIVKMTEKERGKYLGSLKYSLNMAPEIRERGFLNLAKFYLDKGNYLMAGYCFESVHKLDEACQLYFGSAYNRILSGRLGEKGFSEVEELVDIAMTHPNLLDKTRVAYVMKFFDENRGDGDTEANKIFHQLGIIYKAKSSTRKSIRKNKGQGGKNGKSI